jgi:predicted DNA-binding protein with PD1-like motif
MKTYALRLRPGEDLKETLDLFVRSHQLEAACLLTCVGSLRKAVLRFANQEQAVTLNGHFEIVSLTGVLSMHGSHYHIAISDGEGRTYGAHLMNGSLVYTTAEVVLAHLEDFHFLRTYDSDTGFPELEIHPNPIHRKE